MTCSGSERLETATEEPLDEFVCAEAVSMHINADQHDHMRPLPASQCMRQMRPERLSAAMGQSRNETDSHWLARLVSIVIRL